MDHDFEHYDMNPALKRCFWGICKLDSSKLFGKIIIRSCCKLNILQFNFSFKQGSFHFSLLAT